MACRKQCVVAFVNELSPPYLSICLVAVDFFNQINLLYGSITEFCTPKSCPVMSAGPKYVGFVFGKIYLRK
jgi:hypothetical protein